VKYAGIFKTAERVDHEALLAEFRDANPELTPPYGPCPAWTGLRIFDLLRTDRLADFPVLRRTIDDLFGLENVAMVNVYNLAPQSRQHAHRDQSGNLLFGIARIHMPLQTNPGAVLEVQNQPYHLRVGEVWSLDTSGLHAAVNDGRSDRVHVVIDVKRAPQTQAYFPAMTPTVWAHLAWFCGFLAVKVSADLLTRPRTIAERLPLLLRMIGPKLRPRHA
jgi:hypothetical protein